MALSFDDVLSQYTTQTLEVLAQAQVPAIVFCNEKLSELLGGC
ncbi:polysaccharide deacetylase family protein [Colwellia sp. TT2012]